MTFRLTNIVFLVLFSVLLSTAQESTDTLRFHTTFTLGGIRKAGVFAQTNVNGGLSINLSKSNWEINNTSTYTYTNVNGKPLSDDWTVVSKLRSLLPNLPEVSPTFIHVYKKNLLYRIINGQRYLLGASVRPIKKKQAFWFFIGVGYEQTLYNGEAFDNSPLLSSSRTFGISTFYVENVHHLLQNKLYLKYNLFYIQSFEEVSDYSIWLIPSINFKLNDYLAFGVNYDYRFRNVHLAAIPSFNELLTFNVKIALGN